jgi:predicted ATPase
VTITGPGGCGKTRLAVRIAMDLLDHYPGGVWFVGLSSINDPEHVPDAIADALGVPEMEGMTPIEAISADMSHQSRQRPTLLLLDNCEHLTTRCAETADTLLALNPQLKILCTSREPLHVPGEANVRVGPLSLPEPDSAPTLDAIQRSEAVRLFIDRACLADPEYSLDDSSAVQVLDLCHRLDGMPLALELAAARVGLLPFDQILKHIEGRTSSLQPYGTPDRQQTVTATIEWSHDLLTVKEREMLRRLAVFKGGFTVEAADAVCGDPTRPSETLEYLVLLTDKSLVHVLAPRRERYRCLELIQRYAWTQLEVSGELSTMRERHLAYYLCLAEHAATSLTGPEQPDWLLRLADDYHNLRAALEFSRDHRTDRLLRLVLALYRFWFVRGHLTEGRTWADAALATASETVTPLVAKVLSVAGSLAWQQGDLVQAKRRHEDCLAVWRTLNNSRGVQYSLGNLGLVAWKQGDAELARELYEKSLALALEIGDSREIGIVLLNLGLLAGHVGDLTKGLASLHEALRITRGLGDPSLLATVLTNLGGLTLQSGRDGEAREYYEESLRYQRSLNARGHLPDCLDGIASIAARGGQQERALRLAGAAASIREVLGVVTEPWSRHLVGQWLDEARTSLGAAAVQMWEDGRALPDYSAIKLALDEE